MDKLTKECAYGELALEIAVEVLETANIRPYAADDHPALSAAIKAVAARLAAERHDPDYENERVIGMAHGNLLQPQSAANALWDESERKARAARVLETYADKRYKPAPVAA